MIRRDIIGLSLLVVGALSAMTLSARAQGTKPTTTSAPALPPDEARFKELELECERAVQVVRTGSPAAHLDWALGYVKGCEGDADAIASFIPSLRAISDTTVLFERTGTFDGWRDEAIYQAAMRLAANNTATPESRVFAMNYLLTVVLPNQRFEYFQLASDASTRCASSYRTDGLREGRPLPSDYMSAVHALGKRLAKPSSPPAVQNAASCLLILVREN